MSKMEDPTSKLMNELRPRLDETTILSISSDYNLEDPQEFAVAREVLLSLSKDVEAEEASGFNPSGLGIDSLLDNNPLNQDNGPETAAASSSDVKSIDGLTTTTETSMPSLASGRSSNTSTRDTPEDLHMRLFDGLSYDAKVGRLLEMFVKLKHKHIDVEQALRRSKGDASLAFDDLLNLQFLEETGLRPKGIDGFFVLDDGAPRKKKGKKKRGVNFTSVNDVNSYNPSGEEANDPDPWYADHIQIISDRLNLAPTEVTSIYQQHGASSGATVVKILNNYIALDVPSSDLNLLSEIQEAAGKYSWIPNNLVKAAFEICSSQEDAMDIIRMLADHFEKPALPYSVVAASSGETTFDLVNASTSSKPYKPRGRSGSNYARPTREEDVNYRQAGSAEANRRVDSQSRGNMIDLHGVTVQDGVDIALERVWKWWQGRGEQEGREPRPEFEVVTGLGRHSDNGISPLRVRVSKELAADGWKMSILTGSFLITGRQ
ncbi:hypothetical protein GGR54DRAFT_588987 [Hypoxylon sp. NC1633]|nr:hypothetical protein GGR54DRAFT_588987 [Hypoxylon sp. NC1633]